MARAIAKCRQRLSPPDLHIGRSRRFAGQAGVTFYLSRSGRGWRLFRRRGGSWQPVQAAEVTISPVSRRGLLPVFGCPNRSIRGSTRSANAAGSGDRPRYEYDRAGPFPDSWPVTGRERDFDGSNRRHRPSVLHRRPVPPPFDGIESRRHQQRVAANRFQPVNRSVLADESGQPHRRLNVRVSRQLGIARVHSIDQPKSGSCRTLKRPSPCSRNHLQKRHLSPGW
jgi:hypothetical protein